MRSDPKREAERWLSQAEMEWSDACFLLELCESVLDLVKKHIMHS